MKIGVCISKVPDTTAKIEFIDNNTKFNAAGVQFIINPYDEWYALVRALELKETLGGSVTVIHVGGAANEPIIRKALALGADDAVRVDTDPEDAWVVASNIAGFAKEQSYDILFTGKETIDYNGSIVGGMLAGLLDLPYISLASKLDVENGKLRIEREVEGVKETLLVSGPCLIGAQKGMAEARIPNMRGILASKSKPLQVMPANGESAWVHMQAFILPPAKKGCHMIAADHPEELVELLHSEAKVI